MTPVFATNSTGKEAQAMRATEATEPSSERKKSRALAEYPALLPHKEEKGVSLFYRVFIKKQ
jgi:hypothetical protein